MMIYVIPDKPSILKYFIYFPWCPRFQSFSDFRAASISRKCTACTKREILAQNRRCWPVIGFTHKRTWIVSERLMQSQWRWRPWTYKVDSFWVFAEDRFPRRPPLSLKITLNSQIFLMSWLKLGLLGSQRLSWWWWSCIWWRSLTLWSDYDNWGLVYDQLLYHFFQAFCLESLKNSHLGTYLLFSCPSSQFSPSYCPFSSPSSSSSSSSPLSSSSSSSAQLTDTEPLSPEWQQRAQEELQEKKEWRERDIQVFRRTLEG